MKPSFRIILGYYRKMFFYDNVISLNCVIINLIRRIFSIFTYRMVFAQPRVCSFDFIVKDNAGNCSLVHCNVTAVLRALGADVKLNQNKPKLLSGPAVLSAGWRGSVVIHNGSAVRSVARSRGTEVARSRAQTKGTVYVPAWNRWRFQMCSTSHEVSTQFSWCSTSGFKTTNLFY